MKKKLNIFYRCKINYVPKHGEIGTYLDERECTQNMSTKQINVLKKLKKTDQKNKKKTKSV